MTPREQLPDFYIIGAAKSGTTTLYDALNQHPAIEMSPVKEPRFFSNDEKFSKGTDWYVETYYQKERSAVARGEASPQYLYWSEKSAPRLKAAYSGGKVKFVSIFREPVQRAYSHYWHEYRYGWVERSFVEAIRHEDEDVRKFRETNPGDDELFFTYYRGGLYASQLKPFLDLFPRETFLFLLQDDLEKDFSATVARLLAFLEVDTVELPPLVSNAASQPRSRALVDWLKTPAQPNSIKDFVKHLLPLSFRNKAKKVIRRANQKPIRYPPMDASLRRELGKRYVDEVKELERLIERDLSHWIAANK